MRLPISSTHPIPGVGRVFAGRVEQGVVKLNEDCLFLPSHTASHACQGKVKTIEIHGSPVVDAKARDYIGLAMSGLDNMPKIGDVMVYKSDGTLKQCESFVAQILVLDIPGEIKCGYSTIGWVGCAKSPCRITKLGWKMGKETGMKKLEDPHSLKSNEAAECTFQPQRPLVVDTFKKCEGLSRIAFKEKGKGVVMIGKIVSVVHKVDVAQGG